MTKLIIGCGYLGQRVARRWQEAGENVAVVTRQTEKARQFAALGYRAVEADVTRPDTLQRLPVADTVLFAVGFDPSSGHSMERVYAGGVGNVLAALPDGVERFIYISTTGVYGGSGGDWVDENTPPDPRREGARASLVAEQLLAGHALGRRSTVLRMAGLYGPGRVPFLESLRAGKPIPVPCRGYLNLIHEVDAAAVVIAAAGRERFGDGPRMYCVSDGHPVERDEYYRQVSRQLGTPPPVFAAPDPDSPRALRAGMNRRIDNGRLRAELGVQLIYPDYRSGLRAILETENQQATGSARND